MPAVIRLKRVGAKKDPSFRIVVADSRRARDGRFIEQLGFYDPQPREAQYRVDVERTQYWLGVGAQASDQVRSLLRKAGVPMPSRAAKKKAAESKPAKSKSGAKGKSAKASTREQARRMRKREDRAARKSRASKTKARPATAGAPAEAAPVS